MKLTFLSSLPCTAVRMIPITLLLHETVCTCILFSCCTLCVSSFYRFVILWLRIFLSYIVPSLWYDWNCYISLNSFTFVAIYLHWVYRNCLFYLVAHYYFCYFHLLFSTFFFLRTFSWSLKFIFDTKFSDNYMLSMLSNLFLSKLWCLQTPFIFMTFIYVYLWFCSLSSWIICIRTFLVYSFLILSSLLRFFAST